MCAMTSATIGRTCKLYIHFITNRSSRTFYSNFPTRNTRKLLLCSLLILNSNNAYNSNSIAAHRVILAAASTYFLELFDNVDDDCNSLTITKMDSDTFEQLVVFCYNGQTDISAGNADRMIKGAMLLRLYVVVDICMNYMMDHISDFLVRKLITLTAEIDYKQLETRLLAYIVKNFKELNRNGEIFGLNVAQWKSIINEVDVNVVSQTDIFWAIKGWYEHKVAKHQQYLPDLIGSLRLAEFDGDFLRQQIKPLPGCEGLATEALKKRAELPSWVAVQNWGEDWLGYKYILIYDQAKEEWIKAKRFEIKRYYFSTAFIENILFFIGGRSMDGVSKAVLSYNLLTKNFTIMPPLQDSRTSTCVAVANNCIYALGGKSNNAVLLSVERYSTATGRWQYMSALPTPRASAAVAIMNDDIYIIGGTEYRALNTVVRYNVATNSWRYCKPMADARESPAAVTHQGYIYAMGGRFNDLKTVERYDPQRDAWTKVAALNVARRYICAASVGNQLWAFGGVIGPAQWDDTVEVYDVANDKWLVKKKLPITGKFDCVTMSTNLADSLK